MLYNITTEDRNTISLIGQRFQQIASRLGREIDQLGIELDVIFCHLNDVKLDLDRLLSADDSNFVHDVAGINRHIDRKTGKLQDCFYPRFAVRSSIDVSKCEAKDGDEDSFSNLDK